MLVHGVTLIALTLFQQQEIAPASAIAPSNVVPVKMVAHTTVDLESAIAAESTAGVDQQAQYQQTFSGNVYQQTQRRGLFGGLRRSNRGQLFTQGRGRNRLGNLFAGTSRPQFSTPRMSMPKISLASMPVPSKETLMKPVVAYNNLSPITKAVLKTAVPPLNFLDLVSATTQQLGAVQSMGGSFTSGAIPATALGVSDGVLR